MRLYTDISMIYEGMENSLFFVEGSADAVFNTYIKNNRKHIASMLSKKGVAVGNFNIASPASLDAESVKGLVLRQQPTLSSCEVERMVSEFKSAHNDKGRSRLMFIADVGLDANGCYEAKVFCEEDFGNTESDFVFKLNTFLDVIVAYYAEQNSNGASLSTARYKLPEEEHDALCGQDNYECLCNDILAESVCDSGNVKISPILFDEDFNISLPLYPSVTIVLEPLPKTLYILFLNHPEGIVLKDIQMYETELKKIYGRVSGRKNPTVINRIFRSLVDPTDNPLHKNLSIIRRCFTSQLNYNIARNYIPAHGRTKAHNIPLESEYVILPTQFDT